jgi:hypothetical protein
MRILALPLMGKALPPDRTTSSCPTSGTIGTGQTADGDWNTARFQQQQLSRGLYDVVPVAARLFNSTSKLSHRPVHQHDREHRAVLGLTGRHQHGDEPSCSLSGSPAWSRCPSPTTGSRFSGAATCSSLGGVPAKSFWMGAPATRRSRATLPPDGLFPEPAAASARCGASPIPPSASRASGSTGTATFRFRQRLQANSGRSVITPTVPATDTSASAAISRICV